MSNILDVNGKKVRVTEVDIEETVAVKLSGNVKLEIHKAQIDLYNIKTGEVVERKLLQYGEAIAFGKEAKLEFPELGYRITQIVE